MYNPTVQSIIFLEKILEWDGSLDEFSIELSAHFSLFWDNNLDSIKKEMLRSAKTYFSSKKHRDVMKLLDQPLRGDIPAYRMQNPTVRSIISFFKKTHSNDNE